MEHDYSNDFLAGLPRRYGILAAIWSVLVCGSLLWAMHQETRITLGAAAAAARANISKDIIFRKWATSHGGVYVPPTSHTPPNPYLKLPDRDVVTTTGKALTLMNPAYMLRELQADFADDYGTKSHITSLKLLNPKNAPDAWETEALHAFEQGEKERLEVQQMDGQPYLRMMLPLIAEQGCLKCHGFQGYKVGDIRGGLSTAISLAPYRARERELSTSLALTHGAIWLIGLAGLGLSYRRDRNLSAERQKTENELRESEQKYHMVADHTSDWEYWIGVGGEIIYMSPSCKEMTGHDAEEFSANPELLLAIVHPEDRAVYEAHWHAHSEHAAAGEAVFRIISKDGETRWISHRCRPVFDQSGNWRGIRAGNRDITGHERAEATRTQLAAIVESSNDAIIGKSPDGIITSWNKSAEAIYGYSADEIVGKPITMLAPPSGHAEIYELLEMVRKGGTVVNHESERIRKDGTLIQVALTLSPIRDAAGNITGISTIARDITERKKAEVVLCQSEEALKEAQRIAHLGSWHLDIATNQIVWSEELYKMYGFDPALPPPLWNESMKLFTPESWERLSTTLAQTRETGIPYELELETVQKDGGRGWMLARGELVHDVHGAAVGVRGVVMDITARKQAEEQLRRSEHGLSEAQRIAHLGNWELDLTNNALTWSDEIYRIFEIDPKKFGASYDAFLDTIHPDDREMVNRAYSDSVANKVPYDIVHRLLMKDGRVKYVHEKCETHYGEDGKPLRSVGTVHDITERKKVELELRELNNDFVTLLENTGDFIYFKDKDSRIRFCSQTMANITGHHSWRDMIGKHDLEVFPEDTARIYYEEELPIFREGRPLLNKTDPYYDGQGRPGWVNTNKWPVFGDDKQTVVGIFGISRDITELKHAEDKINELNRDLEARVVERTEQLEAANKELEAFSYSVSHDLRAPLRAIDGFSHILLDDYADKLDDEGKRLLNVVRDNTRRMGQLIDDILKFSRAGRLEITYSEIDMEALAREVYEELQPVAGYGLQMEIGHIPPAMGDRAMMRQVFVNLLSNAIKFSRSSATAKIKVGGSIEGDEAVYYVKDNGVGFDMQYADKLFGVFQRLHGVTEFEGTGIGLAIVKRVITRHGGRVWAEGKVGEGATVYFALPSKEKEHG